MTTHTFRTPRPRTTLRALGAMVVLTAALAACSSPSTDTDASGPATSTTAPGTTTAPDATASPTTDPGAGGQTGGGETTAPTPEPTTPSAGASPSASPSPTSLRTSRCTADHLTLALSEGDGAAAGSRLPYLVVTNTGSTGCTLQGWPGVSFVGHGDGTQIGAAADLDRTSTHATVTLAPKASAHAPLKIAVAENYPAETCTPTTPDGLRVYVPGETHSLYVATTDYTACASADVSLMSVQAFQPGA